MKIRNKAKTRKAPTKEAKEKTEKQWQWKVATALSIVGLAISIIVAVVK